MAVTSAGPGRPPADPFGVGVYQSSDPGRGGEVGTRVSTDPGREGDPLAAIETPGQTALLNERARLDAQAAEDAANAAAERARGIANANEADAYRIAAGTAGTSADLEMQASAIQALQQSRQVRTSIGAQRADVAASGFQEAGTNISLLRDSIAQGGITDALTRLNGNISVAGYRGQQTAALGEQAAAEGNSRAAQILAQQYADAGVLATSQSANLAAAYAANPTGTTLAPVARTAATTGVGGTSNITGFGVRPTRADPFLEGNLVNPGYNAAYAADPFGDRVSSTPVAPVGNAAVHTYGETTPTGATTPGTGNVTPTAIPAAPSYTYETGSTDAERFYSPGAADTETVQ